MNKISKKILCLCLSILIFCSALSVRAIETENRQEFEKVQGSLDFKEDLIKKQAKNFKFLSEIQIEDLYKKLEEASSKEELEKEDCKINLATNKKRSQGHIYVIVI